MIEQLRLTNSEMGTWRRCRRKWYLGVYRRLTPRVEAAAGTPLTLGTLVHLGLEALYTPGKRGEPLAKIKELCDAKVEEQPAWEHEIRKEQELATIMLEGYMQWLEETGNDMDLQVLASETKIEKSMGDILGVPVTLLSKIDTRVQRRSTGTRMSLENKTVGSLKQALPLLQVDTQLLTEHLVEFLDLKEKGLETERAEGVLYNMLRKVKRTATAKPPFYGREYVSHNTQELRSHWYHVWAQAREIIEAHKRLDAGESHHTVAYPSPTRNCSWDCPFLGICPMLDDGSDVEAAIRDNYVERDPLERYAATEEFQEVI